jgi:hypothetical protein
MKKLYNFVRALDALYCGLSYGWFSFALNLLKCLLNGWLT